MNSPDPDTLRRAGGGVKVGEAVLVGVDADGEARALHVSEGIEPRDQVAFAFLTLDILARGPFGQ
jgi:hypothetical protein